MNEETEMDIQPVQEIVEDDIMENDIQTFETSVIDYSDSLRQLNNNLVFLGCALLLCLGIVSGVLLGRLFNGIFRD